MVDLYKYMNYQEYLNDWRATLPKAGHGELRKIAMRLGVSTTMISQVFRGEKLLSLEMADELSDYLGLSEEESEYFLLMVDLARSGTVKLKNRFKVQLEKKRIVAKKMINRLGKSTTLDEGSKSIFYSNWIYSAIRILSDVKGYDQAAVIAEHLKLPTPVVERALDFLVRAKLCLIENNRIKIGPAKTFIDANSPYVALHHQNWRLLAIQKMKTTNQLGFHMTAPVSLSFEDSEIFREELGVLVASLSKRIENSPSENARCLNIDWFQI